MAKSCTSWIDYWRHDSVLRNFTIWKVNAKIFFYQAHRIVHFSKNDSVLNIGCGPGYLEVLLAPIVKNIHAVDVAEQFVNQCVHQCTNYNNVSVALLNNNYTNLHILGKSFSLILCISVVQYYKNISELEALITSAQKIALPGARMLIADLPRKRTTIGFLWDAVCSFFMSIWKGYALLLLQDIWARWICRSHYKSFSNNIKPLSFTTKGLESLIQRMKLNAIIIRKSVSIYANRPSLLIHF